MEDFFSNVSKSVPAVGRRFAVLEAYTQHTLPLHLVAMRNNIPVFCLFLQKAHHMTRDSVDNDTFEKCRQSLNARDIYGNTPLHYLALRHAFPDETATMWSHVNMFCGFGADLTIRNNAGESMGDVADSGVITCTFDITRGGIQYSAKADSVSFSGPVRHWCSVL